MGVSLTPMLTFQITNWLHSTTMDQISIRMLRYFQQHKMFFDLGRTLWLLNLSLLTEVHSKERLLQGLLVAATKTPEKSLIVVFTDNGTKDLKLKDEIMRLKKEKSLEIYLVLTPEYEGNPR